MEDVEAKIATPMIDMFVPFLVQGLHRYAAHPLTSMMRVRGTKGVRAKVEGKDDLDDNESLMMMTVMMTMVVATMIMVTTIEK